MATLLKELTVLPVHLISTHGYITCQRVKGRSSGFGSTHEMVIVEGGSCGGHDPVCRPEFAASRITVSLASEIDYCTEHTTQAIAGSYPVPHAVNER